MWSIGLIVGIAAVASLALMAAGIAAAIAFERRRHHKYIERHFTGVSRSSRMTGLRLSQSCRAELKRRSGHFDSSFRNSSAALTSFNSNEQLNQPQGSPQDLSESGSIQAKKKVLRKTLHGSVKKRSSKGRQLRRTVRLVNIPNSPLSAITEKSDDNHSPSTIIRPALASESQQTFEELNEDIPTWRLPVLKTRKEANHNVLGRTISTGHSITASRSIYVPRSISMSGSLSSAPGQPLPLLPSGGPSRMDSSGLKHHISNVSIESIGSSVLGTTSATASPCRSLAAKSTSEALREFDFGLNTVTKLRSPTTLLRSSSLTSVTPNIVFYTGASENLSGSNGASKPNRVRFKESLVPAGKTNTAGGMAFNDLCSVSEAPEMLTNHVTRTIADNHDKRNVPFFSSANRHCNSTQDRVPLEEIHNQNCNPRISVCSKEQPKGHKRQNCVRISNLPLLLSTSALLEDLDISNHTEYETTVSVRAHGDGMKSVFDHRKGSDSRPQSIPQDPDSLQASVKTTCSRQDSDDGPTASIPATPVLSNSKRWNFDLNLLSTPNVSKSPSPLRTYDSPILPSPAYTSANLYPYQRRSLVRGPRSPGTSRSRSQSPLKNKPRLMELELYGKKRSGSVDIRKSVQLLRSMNSEAHLLSAEQGKMYHQFSSTSNSLRQDTDTKEISDLLTVPDIRNLSRNSLNIVSLPSPLAMLKVGVGKPGAFLSHSSESASRNSIWEDMSVREDSPEPETPPLMIKNDDWKGS